MGTLYEDIVDYGGEVFGREHMETLKACVQCGKCTGGCPSGRNTALRRGRKFLTLQSYGTAQPVSPVMSDVLKV